MSSEAPDFNSLPDSVEDPGKGKGGKIALILAAVGLLNIVVIVIMVVSVVLAPMMAMAALKEEVFGFLGLSKKEGNELVSQIPDDAQEEWAKYKDLIEQEMDCSNLDVSERKPGENCIVGLIGSDEGQNWSPVPDSANWLVPVWQAAGRRYHIPWEVLAALNGARTSFGQRICETNSSGYLEPPPGDPNSPFEYEVSRTGSPGTGFYRMPARLWFKNNVNAGTAKEKPRGSDSLCESSEAPAQVYEDFKKPLEKLVDVKKEELGGSSTDAVDATFAMARNLALEGAWKNDEWKYKGSPAGQCTVPDSAGNISYPPTPPSVAGGSGGGVIGFNKKLRIPRWAPRLAAKYVAKKGQTGKYTVRRSGSAEDSQLGYHPMPKRDIVRLLTVAWEAFGAKGSTLDNNVTLNYAQVGRESGGRPYVLQDFIGDENDNNPAGGLFQFIPSTFEHWKVDGYNNRFNPLDNILAAVNAQVNGPYSILDGSSGWSPPLSTNPYATGGKAKNSTAVKKKMPAGKLKPLPYKGKKQNDDVSKAVLANSDETGDDCYVAVINGWYKLIKKYPPEGASGYAGTMPKGMRRLFGPRKFVPVPAKYCAGRSCTVDARILPNLVYLMDKYKMVLSQGRNTDMNTPSVTHGDGTGADLIPGPGGSWDLVDKAAHAVGFREPGCTASGTDGSPGPGCPIMPNFIWVGYNGVSAPNHGRPPYGNHLHLSWANSCYGCGGGAPVPPREWVMVFGSSDVAPLGGKGGKAYDGPVKGNINHIWAEHNSAEGDWGGPRLPRYVIAALAQAAGMPGRTMEQMTRGESMGRPGSSGVDDGGTKGFGLWAITTTFNDYLARKVGGYRMFLNPVINAWAAGHIYRQNGLKAWYGDGYVQADGIPYKGKYDIRASLGGLSFQGALWVATNGKIGKKPKVKVRKAGK